MEPLSLILSAIVAGAAAAGKDTAAKAVKDAYEALKAMVKKRWAAAPVEKLEDKPADKAAQQQLKDEIQASGKPIDREVQKRAQQVMALVERHDPDAAVAAGISLTALRSGANMRIEGLSAAGAVTIKDAKAKQDLVISGVSAGVATKKPRR